jgi:dimethylargininase
MSTALVRRPSPRLAEGIVSGRREPVDVDAANRQWSAYVDTLTATGWTVAHVEPADDCPDSVFVEDTMVVYGDVAVITRPGAPARRAETDGAEAAVRGAGYEVLRIEAPGTLDGGDVLKVGDTVYVGASGRTDADGAAQLREVLTRLGAEVVTVPVSKVLHLKSAVTALPDGTVIGFAPLVDDPSVFPRFLQVPEESGAHVVHLGDGRLLVSDDCPLSAELFESRGYQVVPVGISEFGKLDGCVTCLSVRLAPGFD